MKRGRNMTFNKDLILRLDNEDLGSFLRYCLKNNLNCMDGIELSKWNEHAYRNLYNHTYPEYKGE